MAKEKSYKFQGKGWTVKDLAEESERLMED